MDDNQDHNKQFDQDAKCFPLKPRFYIVNDFERPAEKFVTELADDGKLYYIHPELRVKWSGKGLSAEEATSLEDFGIHTTIKDGVIHGQFLTESIAGYRDGKPRRWQGDLRFSFLYLGLPNIKTMFNIFDHLTNPDDIGADEYRAIYECLDSAECASDPEFAITVCEEFQDHAATIITKLQKAMEAALRA